MNGERGPGYDPLVGGQERLPKEKTGLKRFLMRMWMVNPKRMCDQHLLGEHVECHMLLGSLKKRKRLDGFVKNGLIQPLLLSERHGVLVNEMERRGMNHKSPLKIFKKDLNWLPEAILHARVNKRKNMVDLLERCGDCRKRKK